MCRIVLAKYKMHSVGGDRGFFYCEDLFVQNFFLMDVIWISCHSLVLFHRKHYYCAKCTVFKRMWMCIVSEPNKYNDVKSYFFPQSFPEYFVMRKKERWRMNIFSCYMLYKIPWACLLGVDILQRQDLLTRTSSVKH